MLSGAPGAPARKQTPRRTKLAYGFGSVAEGVKDTAFNTFLLFYYNQVLGLPGSLGGAAIFLALCVDAITDPLVGSLSDNFRSRLGRRHPFLYASALPMGVSFWLLFNPPRGLGNYGLFAWFTVFAVLVRSAMTLYSIPSNSMVAELTDDYDDRTALVGWRFLFGWLGGIAFAQVGYRFFFHARDGMADGRLDANAYGAFAAVGAVAIVAAILVCALGTHRLIPTLKPPPAGGGFTLRGFVHEVRDVLANRSYRVLVIGSLFSSVAAGFTNVVGLYVGTYYWGLGTDEIALLGLSLIASLLLAVGSAGRLVAAFEKHRVAAWLAAVCIVFGPLPIFLRLAGWMPPNGHPALLPILLVHGALLVAGVIVIGIVISSMIADTVDESELATGKRQEGMFSAAIAFAAKATSGVGGFLAGLMLDVIAFPTQAAPGSVPPEKLTALGIAVGPTMMGLYLLALVFLARYHLTRARHQEILGELARRHEAAAERRANQLSRAPSGP
jgi:Na+/melibiose symporter-like transporter